MAVTWPRTLRRRHPSKGRSMTKDETLKLALETLESIQAVYPCETVGKRITAIKETLAQPAPVQEPLAWMEMVVANLVREGVNKHKARELAQHFYTPPQRTWVGLTEEDLKLLSAEWRIVYGAWMDDFARDIEAKLKEMNT